LECEASRELDNLGRCILTTCPSGQVLNKDLGYCGVEVTPTG
jgi:hypothetical protein